jgi:hypothetical protein
MQGDKKTSKFPLPGLPLNHLTQASSLCHNFDAVSQVIDYFNNGTDTIKTIDLGTTVSIIPSAPSATDIMMNEKPRRSHVVTRGVPLVIQRAQLRARGLDDEAIAKPFVGVAHTYGEVSPCAMSLAGLAARILSPQAPSAPE